MQLRKTETVPHRTDFYQSENMFELHVQEANVHHWTAFMAIYFISFQHTMDEKQGMVHAVSLPVTSQWLRYRKTADHINGSQLEYLIWVFLRILIA